MNRSGTVPSNRVKYAIVLSLLTVYGTLSFLLWPEAEENLNLDIIGEAVVLIQPIIWLFFVNRLVKSSWPNRLMTLGLLLFSLGSFHDLLDEFLISPKYLSILENVGIPLGLFLVSISVIIESLRKRAYLKLVEHKESVAYTQSMTDPLTELGNQRYLKNYLNGILGSPYTELQNLSVVFLDIDNFKLFNDNFGHQKGDEVLQKLSAIIRAHIREKDVAFRYGGEEFFIVLQGTSLENAGSIAERIRRGFVDAYRKQSEELNIKVSLSVGVTCVTSSDSLSSLIKRVDDAMYQSKHQGKNMVTQV